MIIATLHTPFTVALDFDFDANTNATLKAIGGMWDKPAKVWTLPLRNLDKLIVRFGDVLTCDTEVWLALPVKGVAQLGGKGKAADGPPTRLDALLADGLPRWKENEEREAQQRKGRQWHTHQAQDSHADGRLI